MNDLGLELEQVRTWFPHEQEAPYVLIRVSPENAASWAGLLGLPVRRCYITDSLLQQSAATRGVPEPDIIAARLPDPGAIMSGDFGEIVVYLYQGAQVFPAIALGATKWRLKEGRNRPTPLSDIVHLVLHSWPTPSEHDTILCSEVKAKATIGAYAPIKEAIKDVTKNPTSRLARTLTWLRERALTDDLGDLQLAHLERFINATEHPEAKRHFRAVAVVCSRLLEAELVDAPSAANPEYTVVVIAVPDLRATYTSVFAAAAGAVVPPAREPV